MLDVLSQARPVSLHGVGLSLAGADEPSSAHLSKLRLLVERYKPVLISEHLAWSQFEGAFFPDLLPFPRSRDALRRTCRNVDMAQEAIGQRIAIENPSLYLPLDGHEMSETEFLTELVARTGCALLVDVNNVYVSANNIGFDPTEYLEALPVDAMVEIHLAGHSPDPECAEALLIDSHDAPISEEVWHLYKQLIGRVGPRPTLIERDGNVPAFSELMEEQARAAELLHQVRQPAYA